MKCRTESNLAYTYSILSDSSETKLNLIMLSLRLSRKYFFDILAQDKHIKPSLSQLMDQILEKLFLANIKGSSILKKKNFWPNLKNFVFPLVLRLHGTIVPFPKMAHQNLFLKNHLKVGTNENGSACGRWLSIGI